MIRSFNLMQKFDQIHMLIEKNNTVENHCDNVHEDQFEVIAEACEGSVEVESGEQRSDKLNQLMEVLENMGKHLADMSNPVKENTKEDNTKPKSMFSNKVN